MGPKAKPAVPVLAATLQHPEREFRRYAAQPPPAVGLDAGEAEPALRQILRPNDEDWGDDKPFLNLMALELLAKPYQRIRLWLIRKAGRREISSFLYS